MSNAISSFFSFLLIVRVSMFISFGLNMFLSRNLDLVPHQNF